MAATTYKGHEGFLYLQDTGAQNANIPDSGVVADETDDPTVLVGRVEGVTFKVDNAVEAYYGIGGRDPTDIKEGNRAITGTVNRAIINAALFGAAMGTVTGTTPAVVTATALGQYTMKVRLYTSGTQYVWVTLTNVMFSTWSLESLNNAGETVKENLEWLGIFSEGKGYGTPTAGV